MRLPKRSLVAAIHDIAMALVSVPIAYYLRLGDQVWAFAEPYLFEHMAVFMLCFTAALFGFSLQKEVWRYVSVGELKTLAKVVTVSIVITYGLLFLAHRLQGVPRSVPLLHWMVLGGLLSVSRVTYRLMRESGGKRQDDQIQPIHVALVGANDHAEGFIRAMQRSPERPYHVVAVLDRKTLRAGRNIRGVPIYCGLDEPSIKAMTAELEQQGKKPQRLIVTEDYMRKRQMNELLGICKELGIGLARLPRITDFGQGNQTLDIKPIAIEDLLGRAQSHHDEQSMSALIRAKVVLVTGAGGSIGSELVRQIAPYLPAQLILLEQSEFHLYEIERELRKHYPEINAIPVIADVRDAASIDAIIAQHRPDILFHAAALKHVPLAEQNVEQTILTNVFGTQHVARCAHRYGINTFVLISTDKAVHPANVMGASKRLAEYVCLQDAPEQISSKMQTVIVRFGNVLGSTGSVVPLFQEQLRAGGPLTVTHPEMQRYFMTIREASGLVIQAAALSARAKAMFILDMGKPVTILDLAKQMIRLAGYEPERDIAIRFTGLRPGEKLTEELVYDEEQLQPTEHPRIKESAYLADIALDKGCMDLLKEACNARDAGKARYYLQQLVQEYCPDDLEAEEGQSAPIRQAHRQS